MKKTITISLFMLAALGLPGEALATVIRYDDFSSTTGLSRNGYTRQAGDDLRLTDLATYSSGAVYSTTAVDITRFSAAFTFTFSGSYGSGSADGMVFVIKDPDALPLLGGNGLGMGYLNIPESVGVEFDNWYNSNVSDPVSNHIGIDTNGSVASLATLSLTEALNGTGLWYAWVDYDGVTLSVSANQTGLKPGSAMLATPIDIAGIIGSTSAAVGFTAATGGAAQYHDLDSFVFMDAASVPEPASVVLLGIGGLLGFGVRRRAVLRKDR